jgi:hypothetical protein
MFSVHPLFFQPLTSKFQLLLFGKNFMIWYTLNYGGTVLGDELIVPSSTWKSTLVDQAVSLAIHPQFRLRKKCLTAWAFERWIFDLMALADGTSRNLCVNQSNNTLLVNYGSCKLLMVTRSVSSPMASRWSDQVVVTFQAETAPVFS